MKRSKLAILSLFTASVVSATPLLIVVSCGENEDFIDPQTYAQVQVAKMVVDGSPTHEKVAWKNVPVPTSPIAKYLYLEGNYSSIAAAIAAPESEWKDTPPVTVSYNFARRYLYVRAVPVAGRVVDPNTMYFNITSSSGIQAVKSKIDATADFDKLDLDKIIKLSRRADELQIDIITTNTEDPSAPGPVQVPFGAQINYRVGTEPNKPTSDWLDGSLFQAYLSQNSRLYSLEDLRNIQAKIVPINTSRFVLENEKLVTVSQNTVLAPDTTVPQEIVTSLNGIRFLNTSTHDAVTWTGLPTPVSPATKYQFLYGNYPTRDSFKDLPDTIWSDTLPSTIDYEYTQRYLWVKIIPTAGYVIDEPFLPLTISSEIQQIPSKVDVRDEYAAVDLSKIAISGRVQSLVIDDSSVTKLPLGATLVYSLNYNNTSSGSLDKASFLNYVRRLSSLPSNSDQLNQFKTGLKVRLEPTNSHYTIINNKETTPLMTTLRSTEILNEEDVRYEFSQMTWLPGSTSSKMIWSATPSGGGKFSAWFAYGNFTSVEQVVNYFNGKNPFTTNPEILFPPSVISSNPSERRLWVRILPSNSADRITMINPYIDITLTSNIQSTEL